VVSSITERPFHLYESFQLSPNFFV
jgi:hypothetical protein